MTCGKMSFRTRPDAESYIKAIKRKPDRGGVLSAYHCEECGNYHLTSWTKSKQRHVARVILSLKRKKRAENFDEQAKAR